MRNIVIAILVIMLACIAAGYSGAMDSGSRIPQVMELERDKAHPIRPYETVKPVPPVTPTPSPPPPYPPPYPAPEFRGG